MSYRLRREKAQEDLKVRYVPLDLPASKTGRPRLAEAIRYMRAVIRDRQNVEADFLDAIGEEYDWDNELMNRWMPSNGVYRPEIEYERKRNESGK